MNIAINNADLTLDKVQVNGITMKPYAGENQMVLKLVAMKCQFVINEWVTFLQAKQLGRRVKKGARGTRITKMVEKEIERDGMKRRELYPRHYVVFNLEQTELDWNHEEGGVAEEQVEASNL